MNTYEVRQNSIGKRLLIGIGMAVLYAAIMIWIPVLGWIALIFTPVVLLYPLFAMRESRAGSCPYCGSHVTHMLQTRSFKCGKCKQLIIITDTEFRKPV